MSHLLYAPDQPADCAIKHNGLAPQEVTMEVNEVSTYTRGLKNASLKLLQKKGLVKDALEVRRLEAIPAFYLYVHADDPQLYI